MSPNIPFVEPATITTSTNTSTAPRTTAITPYKSFTHMGTKRATRR